MSQTGQRPYAVHQQGDPPVWGVHETGTWRAVNAQLMTHDDAVALCERLNRDASGGDAESRGA